MRLPKAYRSLPRPSSQLKPSYPSNSNKNYFIKKGFLNTEVDIKQDKDTTITNSIILSININKNHKVKLDNIRVHGNISLTEEQVRRAMKETKEKRIYRLFKTSKFIEEDFKEDLVKIIDKYNELGFRDAKVITDFLKKEAGG